MIDTSCANRRRCRSHDLSILPHFVVWLMYSTLLLFFPLLLSLSPPRPRKMIRKDSAKRVQAEESEKKVMKPTLNPISHIIRGSIMTFILTFGVPFHLVMMKVHIQEFSHLRTLPKKKTLHTPHRPTGSTGRDRLWHKLKKEVEDETTVGRRDHFVMLLCCAKMINLTECGDKQCENIDVVDVTLGIVFVLSSRGYFVSCFPNYNTTCETTSSNIYNLGHSPSTHICLHSFYWWKTHLFHSLRD